MQRKLLEKCTLFAGLSDEDRAYALRYFSAEVRNYDRGEYLNQIGSPLRQFGLVLSGTIQVYMDDIDGNHMIMANVGAGGTFGESLCFLGQEAPVYICAVTAAEILWMDTDRIHRQITSDPRDAMLANRFIAMLAERALAMNDRIQILSKITIRDKLITFFSQYASRSGSGQITIPFDRDNMATYLGVNRSALSRELSRMRDEGIIDFHKNTFVIHHLFAESGR